MSQIGNPRMVEPRWADGQEAHHMVRLRLGCRIGEWMQPAGCPTKAASQSSTEELGSSVKAWDGCGVVANPTRLGYRCHSEKWLMGLGTCKGRVL